MKLVFSMALMLFMGCSNLCQRAESVAEEFNRRQQPCSGSESTFIFDKSACDTKTRRCSPEEVSAFNAYLDCLSTLPVCEPGSSAAFGEAVLQCTSLQHSLSCIVQ
jgi:hypothetical protein